VVSRVTSPTKTALPMVGWVMVMVAAFVANEYVWGFIFGLFGSGVDAPAVLAAEFFLYNLAKISLLVYGITTVVTFV